MFSFFPEFNNFKQQPAYGYAPQQRSCNNNTNNASCARQSSLFHDLHQAQKYYEEQEQLQQQAERKRRLAAEQRAAALRRQKEHLAQQEAAQRQQHARQQQQQQFGDYLESLFKDQLVQKQQQQKSTSPRSYSNNNTTAAVVPSFYVSQDNTQIKVVLPKGFNKQLLQVEYDDNTQQLSIFAKQHFFKRFAVPANANTDAIVAKWNDEESSLLVTVPIKQKKSGNIRIQQEQTAGFEHVATTVSNSKQQQQQLTATPTAKPQVAQNQSQPIVSQPTTPESTKQEAFDEWAPIVEDDPEFVHAPKPKKFQQQQQK